MCLLFLDCQINDGFGIHAGAVNFQYLLWQVETMEVVGFGSCAFAYDQYRGPGSALAFIA
jgi:hypothetical protein